MDEFGRIYTVAKPRALILRGRFLLLGAQNAEGLSTLKSALAVARSLHMAYEEGLAYYELAKHQTSNSEVREAVSTACRVRVGSGDEEEG